jgi:hypothetical protein
MLSSSTIPNNVTVLGSGYASEIVEGAHAWLTMSNNTMINNIHIDDAAGTCTANGDFALDVLNPSDATVENSWILNAGCFGIFVQQNIAGTSGAVNITGNFLTGEGNNDVIGGGATPYLGQHLVQVNISGNNIIQNNSVNTGDNNAIDIVAQNNTNITNNILQGQIILGGEQVPTLHATVTGNTIQPAIGTNYGGIQLSQNTTSSAATSSYINVTNNNITLGQIYLQSNGPENATTSEIIVANNNISGSVSTSSAHNDGIIASGMQYGSITGNNIVGASTSLYLSGTDSLVISNNVFASYNTAVAFNGTNTNNQFMNNIGYVVPTQWTAVTSFSNSWVNYGSGFSYYKDLAGVVHIKGFVHGGTVGTAIFTLPAADCPPDEEVFAVSNNDLYGEVRITTGGVVEQQSITGANNSWLSLDGISFPN